MEKPSSNPDSLPLTLYTDLLQNWKHTRIMLKKVKYFSRAKKMLFALKSGQNFHSGWNSRSPSKSQNLVRNSDSNNRVSKLSSQIKVISIEKWSEFSFWISRSPSKSQKLVRNSDSNKKVSKLSSQIKVIWVEKWSEFSFWISRSPSKFQKLVRNSDGRKKFERSELEMSFLPKSLRINSKFHRI